MQLTVPPDLETLIHKRISSGGCASAEEVLRRALEAQDAEESWTDEERRAFSAHIEEGYRQAVVYRPETNPIEIAAVMHWKRDVQRILKRRG